jgi:hypothetical protein
MMSAKEKHEAKAANAPSIAVPAVAVPGTPVPCMPVILGKKVASSRETEGRHVHPRLRLGGASHATKGGENQGR